MKDDEKNGLAYIIVRYIQMVCIGAFFFGLLWEGTIQFNLTTPQFLMLYGGSGAAVSEIIARLFKKKIEKVKK